MTGEYFVKRIHPFGGWEKTISPEDDSIDLKEYSKRATKNISGDVLLSVEGEDAESYVENFFSRNVKSTYTKIGTPNPDYCLILKNKELTPTRSSRKRSREELDEIVDVINKEQDEIRKILASVGEYKCEFEVDDILLSHALFRYGHIDLEKAFPDLDEKIENLERLKKLPTNF